MSKQWEVAQVAVHKERHDGEYKGQIDLCGCGGGMPVSFFGEASGATNVQGQVSQSRCRCSECAGNVVGAR